MWLLKEIYYHRREHYLTVLAHSTAVFLLLVVGMMCDSGEVLIRKQADSLGLDVTLCQIMDESGIPADWEKDFIKKYGISCFSQYRSIPFGKLQIVSCDPDLRDLFDLETDNGCFLNECDSLYNSNKAVLGHGSWVQLGHPEIGETICLNGVSFKVAGVLKEYSENLFVDLDNGIFICSGYCLSDQPESISYYFHCKDRYVEDYLHQTLGSDNVLIISQRGTDEAINSIFNGVKGILNVIAGVSLTVALMGMVNSSLNNVRKRSYEIGIKKSLGAGDRDIYVQFVLEGVAVISISVTIALILAALVALILPSQIRVINVSNWAVITVRVMIAGMICSLYPALKASQMTVIGALRAKQ